MPSLTTSVHPTCTPSRSQSPHRRSIIAKSTPVTSPPDPIRHQVRRAPNATHNAFTGISPATYWAGHYPQGAYFTCRLCPLLRGCATLSHITAQPHRTVTAYPCEWIGLSYGLPFGALACLPRTSTTMTPCRRSVKSAEIGAVGRGEPRPRIEPRTPRRGRGGGAPFL